MLLVGECLELRDDFLVGGAILLLEAWHDFRTRIFVVAEAFALSKGGGDHAATEGCSGHYGNAEGVTGSEEVTAGGAFDVALEDGVVDLDGCDWGYGHSAAESGGGDGGEADVFDFTLAVKGEERVSDVIVIARRRERGEMLLTLSVPSGRAWSPRWALRD
jgi:hypothetical protein